MTHHPRTHGARPRLLAAVLAFFAVSLFAAPPAHANPNWELYNVGTGTKVVVGDVLSAFGNLRFAAVVNGVGVVSECRVPSGSPFLTHTFSPGDILSSLPGASLPIPLTPDAVISTTASGSKQNICRDTTSGTWTTGPGIDMTTPGSDWTLTLDLPVGPFSPPVYSGTMTASLDLPANAMTIWDPVISCDYTFPVVSTILTGSYSGGVFTPTANQALSVTGSCPTTNMRLVSGALSLSPQISVIY